MFQVQVELFMNLKLYNFFGIICFIPIWVFRGNLNYIEIAFVIISFFLIPCLIHLYFIKTLLKKNKLFNNILLSYYLSLISVYSIDHNLGLMDIVPNILKLKNHFGINALVIPNIEIILIFLILNLIIFLFIFFLKIKGIKILTVFILAILLTNILDYRKNISSFPKTHVKNNKDINENLDYKKKKLVIIFDEMSGINSLESRHPSSLKFNKNIKILFNKYKFAYYVNARSLSAASDISIPTLLNFIYDEENILAYEKLRSKYQNPLIKKSKNYFIENEIINNKFFDNKNYNNIVVYQSLYLDYCKHQKVIRCYQYNPFDRKNLYIEGFNNNFLSRSLSAYTNSLSVIGKYLLRIARQLKIADSFLDPVGEKAAFPYLLNNIANGLEIEKANLFFAHYLVPHQPYFWDSSCKFNGTIESNEKFFQFRFQSMEENVIQHNIERNCVAYYLDVFLKDLSKKEFWPDLEIFIISDHSARLLSEDDNFKSVIFAVKSKNIFPGLFNDNLTINYLFDKLNK